MNPDYVNVQAFVRAAVPDMLAAIQNSVRSARTRFMSVGNGTRFAWIFVERIAPPANDTSGEAHYVLARTNDMDMFAAVPPSLYVIRPMSRVAELESVIVNFLDQELLNFGKVEVLIQSDAIDGTPCASYAGDSDSGYHNVAPLSVLQMP